MKNLLILFASITILMSCGSMASISLMNERVEIGMTKAEFLEVAGDRAEKDAMTETYYVYRVNQHNLDGIVIKSMFIILDILIINCSRLMLEQRIINHYYLPNIALSSLSSET